MAVICQLWQAQPQEGWDCEWSGARMVVDPMTQCRTAITPTRLVTCDLAAHSGSVIIGTRAQTLGSKVSTVSVLTSGLEIVIPWHAFQRTNFRMRK